MAEHPIWATAYCWDCHGSQPIAEIKGIRLRTDPRRAEVAVSLGCGHDRQHEGGLRIVMSEANVDRLKHYLGVAGALTMTG